MDSRSEYVIKRDPQEENPHAQEPREDRRSDPRGRAKAEQRRDFSARGNQSSAVLPLEGQRERRHGQEPQRDEGGGRKSSSENEEAKELAAEIERLKSTLCEQTIELILLKKSVSSGWKAHS